MRSVHCLHSARRCCSTVVPSSEAGIRCTRSWESLPNRIMSPSFS